MAFSIPTPTIPPLNSVAFPSAPTEFSFNTALAAGALSNAPTPSLPAMPAVPAIPSVPGMPAIPTPPAMPVIPDVSGISGITVGGVNALMVNPAGAAINEINSMISNIPSLGELGTMTGVTGPGGAFEAVSEMTAGVRAAVAAEMESLKTKLPIMSAVAGVENAPNALQGILPSMDPPAMLKQATSLITNIGPIMENAKAAVAGQINTLLNAVPSDTPGATAHEKLANFAAAVPSQTIQVQDPAFPNDPTKTIPAPNPAYDTFTTSSPVTSMQGAAGGLLSRVGDVGGMLSKAQGAGAAAVAMGTSLLKDMAFAKFATSNQSAAVQAILQTFVSPPSATSMVEKQQLAAASAVQSKINSQVSPAKYTTPYLPAGPKSADTPPAPTPGTAAFTPAEYSQWKEPFKTAIEILTIYKENQVTTRWADVKPWLEGVNYYDVKKDAEANPDDAPKQAAFKALREQLRSNTTYQDWKDCKAVIDKAATAAMNGQTMVLNAYADGVKPAGEVWTKVTETFSENMQHVEIPVIKVTKA